MTILREVFLMLDFIFNKNESIKVVIYREKLLIIFWHLTQRARLFAANA